jgi:NAD-dependent dihydropyrimidine dehydrogenase PreA subunit
MVVGGGIAGMQAALDLADSGYLRPPGGKIFRHRRGDERTGQDLSHQRLCHVNYLPKLVEVGRHLNINLITCAEVERLREPREISSHRSKNPRFIDLDKCTSCGDCAEVCPGVPARRIRPEPPPARPPTKNTPRPFPAPLPSRRRTRPLPAGLPGRTQRAGLRADGGPGKIQRGPARSSWRICPCPGVLGRICPHGCEDACRRCDVDSRWPSVI